MIPKTDWQQFSYLPLTRSYHGGQPAALAGVHQQEDHVVLRDELLQLLHVPLGLGQGGLGEAHRVAGHGDAHVVSLGILRVNTGDGEASLLLRSGGLEPTTVWGSTGFCLLPWAKTVQQSKLRTSKRWFQGKSAMEGHQTKARYYWGANIYRLYIESIGWTLFRTFLWRGTTNTLRKSYAERIFNHPLCIMTSRLINVVILK